LISTEFILSGFGYIVIRFNWAYNSVRNGGEITVIGVDDGYVSVTLFKRLMSMARRLKIFRQL